MSTDIETKTETATNCSAARASAAEPNGPPARIVSTATVYERPGAEYFDDLLWRLFDRHEDAHGLGYLLGVTGCTRQSGVSTVASNLAIRAADHGLGPVLLVDANDQHPHLNRIFKAKATHGLADVMAAQTALAAAVQPTRVPGLQLLPLGTDGLMRRVRIDPARTEALAAELRESFALVLVDLPGACQMSHCCGLAHALDGAVLVIRSEKTGRGVAQECQRRLTQDGIHLLGAVITDQHTYLPSWLA